MRGRRGRVAARVVLYGLAVFAGLPLAFSQVMTRTWRGPTAPPPPPWTEVTLLSDGLRLRAWVAPGTRPRATVVVAHGVGDRLESFLDLGARFHERGHGVLLLDLRGHGGSEGGHVTLGAREREDVRAALDHVARGPRATGSIVMGFSLGAVAALRAAEGRSDIRAVIVEAPYDNFRDNVRRHAWLLYRMPAWFPVIPLAIAAAEWRGGFDADAVDAVQAARGVRAPLLAVADGADARMPEEVVRRVWAAHPGPKEMWVAPGALHVGASAHPDYWTVVTRFLSANGL
jgi:alpha-beta hydrolase superfamily lysophospholipase